MFTLNCRGKILSLQKPLVMGILNITPDSFYQGHLEKSNAFILELVDNMMRCGVDIIDIGGQSSKPGAIKISIEEELERVIPVIQLISKHAPAAILSIDSFYSEVARQAVMEGVALVNDVSAGEMDPAMIETVAALQVPYVCMHMKGTPGTMQENTSYTDVVKEVLDYFIQKIEKCKKAGIHDVIVDPGFGFGKSIEQNFKLLHNLQLFQILEKPLLVGLSRKSTIYKTLQSTVSEALNGTTVLNTIALLNGASILRVHDVKEAKEAIALVEAYKKMGTN